MTAAQRKTLPGGATYTPAQLAALDAKQRKRYAKFHGKVAKEFARMTTAVVGVQFSREEADAVLAEYRPGP